MNFFIEKIFPKNSLVGNLNKFLFSFVFVILFLSSIIMYTVIVENKTIDRNLIIDNIGLSISRIIERPMGTGQMPLVESSLNIEKLPPYISSLEVFDSEGTKIAVNIKENNCSTSTSKSYPINSKLNKFSSIVDKNSLGYLLIKTSSCDINKFKETLLIILIFMTLMIMIFIYFISKVTIKRSIRPIIDIFDKSLDISEFNKEILAASPIELKPFLKKIQEREGLSNFVKVLVHEIRNPITFIWNEVNYSNNLSSEKKESIGIQLEKIEDTLNNILVENVDVHEGREKIDVSNFLDLLVSEKRVQFRYKNNLESISVEPEKMGSNLFAEFNQSELRIILSNIINNAVEAIPEEKNGIVKITAVESENYIKFEVKDNGIGLEEEKLKKIFQKGFTSGKSKGSGIGLWHAKKSIESHGGKFIVESELGVGTNINIYIPKVKAPKWYIEEIDFRKIEKVVIIDDNEESVLSIWKNKLQGISLIFESYSSPENFLQGHLVYKEENILFVIDHSFENSSMNGIDLITQLKFKKNVILFTSKFEDKIIQDFCEKKTIKLLPKNMLNRIPIIFSGESDDIEIIYVEDEPSINKMISKKLEIEKYKFKSFISPIDAINYLDNLEEKFEKKILISDMNFKDCDITGEELSEWFYYKGGRNIFLVTAFLDISQNNQSNILYSKIILKKGRKFYQNILNSLDKILIKAIKIN